MKLQIQRQGIVIRSVDVSGDRARIGSGEDCEVRIEDPYLSSHIADLVMKNGEWRIVDAGTSLEGVTRNGQRVEDEALAPGQAYTIGGFDLVAEGAAPPPSPMQMAPAPSPIPASLPTMVETPISGTGRSDPMYPKTMMEGDMSAAVPRTMYESAPIPAAAPPRPAAPAPIAQSSGFQPIGPATVSNQRVPGTPAAGRRKLLLLVAGVLVFFILIILVVAVVGGGSKKKPVAKTKTTPMATTATTAPPATDPAVRGDQLLGELKIDDALASWEQALDSKPTSELRARYAKTALEVGLVYSANNDASKARGYFEKVVKYGEASSPEVAKAKAKLTP